jgi:CHAD domain-containing protein
VEIEAKYRADAAALESLAGSAELAGFPLGEGSRHEVTDTYLDTPDWVILAGGYYCRRRRSGERVLVTVKQVTTPTEAVHRREELEVELVEDLPPKEWPAGPARDKVLELSRGEPLRDMVVLRQVRVTRPVWKGEASEAPVAELSLDEVHVQAGGQGSGVQDQVHYMVEVELKEGGSEDHLAALGKALAEDWALQPESRSKFELALAVSRQESPERGPEGTGEPRKRGDKRGHKRAHDRAFLGDGLEVLEKPGLTADDTMAEAANKTLLFHLQRMMQHEPGTREGSDEEELHDMRVATRRMRAALRVFSRYLDAEQYRPFLRGLRETGRELGAVRDLDVFRIKTQTYLDSRAEEQRAGLDPLLEAWERERERARTELLVYLDSSRYQHFKERFETFLRVPGAGAGPGETGDGEPLPIRVGDVLPGVLFDRLADVKAFDRAISQPDAPLVRFHQLRITSKGLRYTLEFFQEVLGADGKPLIDRTKRVQDHLGDLQDAVVACEVLLGFLASGTWRTVSSRERRADRPVLPVNAPGVATYLAAKQQEVHTLMHTFGPIWDQISGSAFSAPLSSLVGAL